MRPSSNKRLTFTSDFQISHPHPPWREEYIEQWNLKPPPWKSIVEWIMDALDKLGEDIYEKLF